MYWIKRSNQLLYMIYEDERICSSICLGDYAEVSPYVDDLEKRFRHRSKAYLPKTVVYHSLIGFKKRMVSHIHIFVGNEKCSPWKYEVGFNRNVSSIAEFLNDNALYSKVNLSSDRKENHGYGYHFHLVNEKGRTNVIVMFNEPNKFKKLLGEYHAEGHNRGNEINVNILGKRVKKEIYSDCCKMGKNVKMKDFKKWGNEGFVFYP